MKSRKNVSAETAKENLLHSQRENEAPASIAKKKASRARATVVSFVVVVKLKADNPSSFTTIWINFHGRENSALQHIVHMLFANKRLFLATVLE